MKFLSILVLAGAALITMSAHANDPKAAITSLQERMTKIGEPRIEGNEKAGEVAVPGIYFGTRKINNNYDAVDEIKKSTGASATVFVKNGDEYVRVSTNILTPEGKRGLGTTLARTKAYEALNKGEQFCGLVDILGSPFDTCYSPVKDKSGKVIGALFTGFKK